MGFGQWIVLANSINPRKLSKNSVIGVRIPLCLCFNCDQVTMGDWPAWCWTTLYISFHSARTSLSASISFIVGLLLTSFKISEDKFSVRWAIKFPLSLLYCFSSFWSCALRRWNSCSSCWPHGLQYCLISPSSPILWFCISTNFLYIVFRCPLFVS